MKSLLIYLRNYKKETILAPLFKMLEASFELFVPLVMAAIIDVGIANRDHAYIIRMCLVLVALGIIGLTCSITAQFFAAKAATGFATELRHSLFSHIQSLTYTDMDTIGTSTLITRMTSDVNQVQSGINIALRLLLRSPFIVVGAMVMAFTVDTKAAFVFVVTIPLLSVVVFGIMAATMPLYRNVQAGLDGILLVTRENLTGARVIRAFNKEAEEKQRFEEKNQALADAQKFVGKISGLMNPITYMMVNGAIMVLIYIGALRVELGVLTQGEVVALINYMSQILVELVKFANLIITVTKGLACAKRIEDVLHVVPDRIEGTLGVSDMELSAPAVEFCDVSLTYKHAGAESLEHVTFMAERGQTIGIIGGTGSGKTSLVNLIPRFYDATGGEVRVFGKNVKEYDSRQLKKKIGVVPQKAVLFKGTIEENLRWGNPEANEQELERALEISQAKEFVDSKPERLQTMVEQNGRNLSGGQKQRLTIARALVGRPEILILDDSASALDFATDAKLRSAIRHMDGSPTVFLVSQRASSVLYADQIIVLDDGQIAGIGTHESLLKGCPEYQEIYYSQFPKEVESNGR